MTRKQLYQEFLNSPEWAAASERVKQRANHTCERCGDKSPFLVVHHGWYMMMPPYHLGWLPWGDRGLYCYCDMCHRFTHKKSPYDPLKGLEAFDEYLRQKFS